MTTQIPQNLSFFGQPVQECLIHTDEQGFIDEGSMFKSFFRSGGEGVTDEVGTSGENVIHITGAEYNEQFLTVWWRFTEGNTSSHHGYVMIDTENFTPEPIDYQEWLVDWMASDGCPLKAFEMAEILRP